MADGGNRRTVTRRTVLAAGISGLVGASVGHGARVRATATAIDTWGDLAALADAGGEYELVGDLTPETPDYEAEVDPDGDGWTPIEAFSGTLDGGGHVIEGLVVDDGDRAGLFGAASPTVSALLVLDVEVSGGDDTGALVGYLTGGSIERVGVSGSVVGDRWVGGLVGDQAGSIVDAYAHASVHGDGDLGGLVGFQYADIERSVATGTVEDPSANGGLVGSHGDGSLRDAYWDIGMTDQDDPVGDGSTPAGGVEGFGALSDTSPASAMQGESPTPAGDDTMPALDFDGVWDAVTAGGSLSVTPASDGYPVLADLDAGAQLTAQGIEEANRSAAIVIEGADDVTISNVTITGGGE